MEGAWTAEIGAGFGDLLDAVGEDVQWTDSYGVLHTSADGTWPQALFKAPGTLILSEMQISDEYAMEYREADFSGIERGDRVGIQGMTFQIREILPGDDQVLKTARLKRIVGC